MEKNDEVLIDYGDSARPAWKCLSSYGFVPEHSPDGSGGDDDVEGCVAEVYVGGIRYEVGPATVPYEMVEAMAAADVRMDEGAASGPEAPCEDGSGKSEVPEVSEDGNLLTPNVALRISERVSDAASQLLLEPELMFGEDDDDADDETTPEAIIAAGLAASLRWSQHRVLLACAAGLRDYAARKPIKQ